MRTATIQINGKTHLLCYSLAVMRDCAEEYGSLEGAFDAMDSANESEALDAALWLTERMMAAGARYAQRNGLETAAALRREELYDLADPADFRTMRKCVVEAVLAGCGRNVTTEEDGDEKNGRATRES